MHKFNIKLKEDLENVYRHSNIDWEEFRNKSIFLTGGTGFFGKWLLESFSYLNENLNLNANITILTRDKKKFLNEHSYFDQKGVIDFLEEDILNFNCANTNFDFIIHAATDSDANLYQSNPLLMMDTITLGTRNILEFAKKQSSLKSFLFISSGAVYGKQPEYIYHVKETETFNININSITSAYTEAKRIGELYCSVYYTQYQIPIKIARCFAFVGPYLPLNKHFAIGNFIENGLNGKDVIIKGDGCPVRSYLYMADLSIWLWTILIKGEVNIPYNVGSDKSVSIEETAIAVAKAFDNIIGVKILQKPLNIPTPRYVPDISKIKKDLGLNVTINLEDAIKRTIAFNKNL